MGFVNEHLSKIMNTENAIRIPTHVMDPDVYTPDILNRAKILCGMNALFSDFDFHPSISLPASPQWYSRQVVLMAVGMCTKRASHFDFLTAKILRNLLSLDYLHSVRDEHTRTELARIGIENVINTVCVTMWNLTEKFCDDIPVSKAENVLTTVTDYDFDPVNDEYMLQTLGNNYCHVLCLEITLLALSSAALITLQRYSVGVSLVFGLMVIGVQVFSARNSIHFLMANILMLHRGEKDV